MLLMNEHGELYNSEEPRFEYECLNVDMDKLRHEPWREDFGRRGAAECDVCGRTFAKNAPNHRYCCPECAAVGRRRKEAARICQAADLG